MGRLLGELEVAIFMNFFAWIWEVLLAGEGGHEDEEAKAAAM